MWKVLVAGANGYLGQNVDKSALDFGCDVLASDLLYDGIITNTLCHLAYSVTDNTDVALKWFRGYYILCGDTWGNFIFFQNS